MKLSEIIDADSPEAKFRRLLLALTPGVPGPFKKVETGTPTTAARHVRWESSKGGVWVMVEPFYHVDEEYADVVVRGSLSRSKQLEDLAKRAGFRTRRYQIQVRNFKAFL